MLQGHVYQHNKKKFDNRTLQTREIKKFPSFSEHTSYIAQLCVRVGVTSVTVIVYEPSVCVAHNNDLEPTFKPKYM